MPNTKEQPLVCRQPGKKRRYIADWLEMKEDDVLARFATLKDAKRIGEGDDQFVFVPGTRDNRILLVAHADTVWSDKTLDICYDQGRFFSGTKGIGIGADDRAGCAMAWQLRETGHSILITNGEESGCCGARFLMKQDEWKKIVNEHQFAIEMDRMNEDDLAFYGVGSTAFKKWCEEQFPKYSALYGLHTDICVLCDPMCGVNISVGYYGQHGEDEFLIESEWQRTLELMRKVCNTKELPKFIQDPKPKWEPTVTYSHGGSSGYSRQWHQHGEDYAYGSDEEEFERPPQNNNVTHHSESDISYVGRVDDIIVCPWCDGIMDDTELRSNNNVCPFCGQEV